MVSVEKFENTSQPLSKELFLCQIKSHELIHINETRLVNIKSLNHFKL